MDKNILTNHQIPGAVIDLIEETQDYCFLVTPYYRSWVLLDRALEKAAKKEKRIVFIFRVNDKVTPEMMLLNQEYGFDLYFIENLHTKLYLNEKRVILSSMNLYDSSKERNFEIGYTLPGSHNARSFKEQIIDGDILSLEPQSIYEGRYIRYEKEKEEEAQRKKLEKQQQIETRSKNEDQSNLSIGYCIRCRAELKHDPNYPFCLNCYKTWSSFSNGDYPEGFCHSCGKEYSISYNKPLCNKCNKEYGNLVRRSTL